LTALDKLGFSLEPNKKILISQYNSPVKRQSRLALVFYV